MIVFTLNHVVAVAASRLQATASLSRTAALGQPRFAPGYSHASHCPLPHALAHAGRVTCKTRIHSPTSLACPSDCSVFSRSAGVIIYAAAPRCRTQLNRHHPKHRNHRGGSDLRSLHVSRPSGFRVTTRTLKIAPQTEPICLQCSGASAGVVQALMSGSAVQAMRTSSAMYRWHSIQWECNGSWTSLRTSQNPRILPQA
jgi:hypothetical protein